MGPRLLCKTLASSAAAALGRYTATATPRDPNPPTPTPHGTRTHRYRPLGLVGTAAAAALEPRPPPSRRPARARRPGRSSLYTSLSAASAASLTRRPPAGMSLTAALHAEDASSRSHTALTLHRFERQVPNPPSPTPRYPNPPSPYPRYPNPPQVPPARLVLDRPKRVSFAARLRRRAGGRVRGARLHLPISPHISPHLTTSPPDLPRSPPDLPHTFRSPARPPTSRLRATRASSPRRGPAPK